MNQIIAEMRRLHTLSLQDQHQRITDAKVWGLLTVAGCLALGALIGRMTVKK